jgi:hypothetical protein
MTESDIRADDQGKTPDQPARPEIGESSGFVDPKSIDLRDVGTIALLVQAQVPEANRHNVLRSRPA